MNLVERHKWAIDRVQHWWDKCNNVFNTNIQPRPITIFSNKMVTTGGRAYAAKNWIKLSLHFLANETPEDYDQTIGHEVAHIFADKLHGATCIHDNRWTQVMRGIGLPPNRCHQYKSAIVRRQDRVRYNCPCGATYFLSKRIVNQIRTGKRKRRGLIYQVSYKCTKCKHPIKDIQ